MTCDDPTCSVPMVKKVPTIPRKDVRAGGVACDSTFSCVDDTTCCKNQTGGWACCPMPQAVCCDDHEHCCPSGTTCDMASFTCDSGFGSTPMQRKQPAFPTPAPATTAAPTEPTRTETTVEENTEPTEDGEEDSEEDWEEDSDEEKEGRIQCDPHSSCPESSTCCYMTASRRWGCCPLPDAVCCADGDHCCPGGYKCDESETTCVKGGVVIPWYTKLPATISVQADPDAVQCDGQNQCPEGTTCCRLATGEWGCCPLQNAVCCPDKEHCCPHGYTCNIAGNSCQKLLMLQVENVPLTPVYLPDHGPQHRDVKCDDQTSCHDGQTCCRMSATTWGCCPLPDAVCCSDMRHCCPHGSTCTDAGECSQDPRPHWFNWSVFLANKKKRALIV